MSTLASTNWERMTEHQRATAVGIDCMNDHRFAHLSGVMMMGAIKFDDALPTAATDGIDEIYNPAFMGRQNRKQWRFVRLHENMHKALRHCSEYKDICAKYPSEANVAMDHVINLMIRELDPDQTFAQDPAGVTLCADPQYAGMSFVEVLRALLKNPPPPPKSGKSGSGQPGPMDEHRPLPEGADPTQYADDVDTALRQGKIAADKLAGQGGRGADISGMVARRQTNWRDVLREFVNSTASGHDMSRIVPPNKRLAPLGILLPSHYTEQTGELVIACDTSGSMHHVYPVVFGEIARLAEHAQPAAIRILWWDTSVQGEQTFKRGQYEGLRTALKPKGCGGTRPACVVEHLAGARVQAQAVIWLTDGYLDGTQGQARALRLPQLWGVVDNERFVPPTGRVMHIDTMRGFT
jgi:predicted metal-dependent peptidase